MPTTPELCPPTVRCIRCGRKLTSRKSIADGFGRECGRKVRASLVAVEQNYSRMQIVKALDLIAARRIERDHAATVGLFYVVCGSNASKYYATPRGCTCKAAEHGRRCYHLAAVEMLSGAML